MVQRGLYKASCIMPESANWSLVHACMRGKGPTGKARAQKQRIDDMEKKVAGE